MDKDVHKLKEVPKLRISTSSSNNLKELLLMSKIKSQLSR